MDRDRLFSGPFMLCSLSNLFQSLTFNLFLHFPGFLKELGAREIQIGILFSLTAVASIGVRPTLGRIMDARGRRGVILASNVLNTAVMALYLTVTAIGPWVYVVRILHGVAAAVLFTALFTYAGVALALRIFLGWVIDRFDYTTVFITAAAFIVAGTAGFALMDRGRR